MINGSYTKFLSLRTSSAPWLIRFYTSPLFLWVILCIGFALRLRQYLFSRSLWLDEASLALNIVEKPFSELLSPLAYGQGEPIGFVLLEKLVVSMFGPSELAFRFLPFLASVLSLFLFLHLATRCVNPTASRIALAIFVISDSLVYYSAEAKRYSFEILASLLLYQSCFYVKSNVMTAWRTFLFGSLGVIVIWFSYPSIFVLAGIGISLLTFSIVRHERGKTAIFLFACLFWFISFLTCYFVSIRHYQSITSGWHTLFFPISSSPISQGRWLLSSVIGVFQSGVGLYFPGLALLTFICGCVSFFPLKKGVFIILILPILLSLLVSSFGKYPFGGRFMLFSVPVLIIIMSNGIVLLIDKLKDGLPIAGASIIILLFLHPLYLAVFNFISPQTKEEMRSIIDYLISNHKANDKVYLYGPAHNTGKYYLDYQYKTNIDYIVGLRRSKNLADYIRDLDKIRGYKRAWIIFSQVVNNGGVNEEKFFLYHLDSIGVRLDAFKSPGASVYLYDLSCEKTKTSGRVLTPCEQLQGG
jgi:hypothetical protein